MSFPLKLLTIVFILLIVGYVVAAYQKSETPPVLSSLLPDASGYDSILLYERLARICNEADDVVCFQQRLNEITKTNGPTAALDVLSILHKNGKIGVYVDDHQIAHEIGRKTAQYFGLNAQAFLACTTNFNYGCQHGFFEYVLGRTVSAREAASLICGTLESDSAYSPKFKFYCYHGVGHGVMMAQAYDLMSSLAVCDSLTTSIGKEGCWQGVFMENVNAAMREEAREGVFSESDPLVPCNKIADMYQHECFINHAGWLMKVFNNNVARASTSCLMASTKNISACLQSIGLMVTNPLWQVTLAGDSTENSPMKTSWDLCLQFPKNYRHECVFGAVDNILNFDELDVTRADAFCSTVSLSLQTYCAERIGVSLRSQATDVATVSKKCKSLKDNQALCLRGAGL